MAKKAKATTESNGAAPKTKRKPPKQAALPTMEPVYVDELDSAARIYHQAKTERVQATETETVAKASAIEKMLAAGETYYESVDGIVLTVTSKSNLKSKRKGETEEEGSEDEEPLD